MKKRVQALMAFFVVLLLAIGLIAVSAQPSGKVATIIWIIALVGISLFLLAQTLSIRKE